MCTVTINCPGGETSGTGYEVLSQTIPIGDPQDPFVQIDAPAGKFVVDFFKRDLSTGQVGLSGLDVNVATDGEGRITGVLFQQSIEAYDAYVVCVNG